MTQWYDTNFSHIKYTSDFKCSEFINYLYELRGIDHRIPVYTENQTELEDAPNFLEQIPKHKVGALALMKNPNTGGYHIGMCAPLNTIIHNSEYSGGVIATKLSTMKVMGVEIHSFWDIKNVKNS